MSVVTGSFTRLNSLNYLGQLANNWGPTQTVALLPGSNAIDGGAPFNGCFDHHSILLPTDQRGGPRVRGANCDIGAFEYGAIQTVHLPFVLR